MKKRAFSLLFILLVAFPLYAGFGVQVVDSMYTDVPASGGTDFTQDANCMGAWYMNGSTTETDRSDSGEDLTQYSGTIPTSADVPTGYSGTSRDFELGDSEDLQMGTDGTDLDINGADQAITVACWIKSETTDYTQSVHVVGKYYATNGGRQYRLGITTGEVVEFRLSSDGTASVAAVGVTNVCDGAWHHIAGVYNDTDIRLYVDGVLDSNGTNNPITYSSGIYNSAAYFYIGSQEYALNFFDGLIDETIVLNRELSASEVSELYTNGISGNKGGSD
jgi:hypothetical protein